MIITLDFETYYSKDYSLSKMTTESYIRDPRFKVHGVGIQVGGGEPVYFFDREVTHKGLTWKREFIRDEVFRKYDWSKAIVLCHNARFDAAILSWHYGIRPAFLLDTLSMARAVFPHESHSLANLSKLCGLGEKGKELVNFLGVETLDDEQQAQMAEYCKNDVRLTWALYNAMKDRFNVSELKVIDRTLRMFTEPVLELDVPVLEKHLAEVQAKKARVLGAYDLTSLRSNQQFADLLRARGVEPPMKMSLRTKKETYAFSKADEGMLALLDHDDEEVQMLASARLGVKSSIEETRTEAMLGIASRGALPVALNYFGAGNTGRFGGAEKINIQNLPRGGALRKAIVAPEGHVLCVADFAAIEARMLAWLSGQADLVQAFHDGEDIYCSFASRVYGRTITKADKKERFLGKVCLAEGTLVLCQSGWKPIEDITLEDEVWDGESWVKHQGLLNNGTAQTLNLCGLWLTPDHLVWSGTEWLEAQLVEADADTLSRALATGAENLPSQGICWESAVGSKPLSLTAGAAQRNTQLTGRVSRCSEALDATSAQKLPEPSNGIGHTQKLCPKMTTENDCSTDSLPQSADATPRASSSSSITEAEVSPSTKSGEMTDLHSYGTSELLTDGITLTSKWTGQTQTETTNRGTSDSSLEAKTFATSGESQTLRRLSRVYDLACAGPKNRFTVLSQSGPLIVHNCILGLGYSMGWRKLASMLAVGPMGQAPILFTMEDLEAMGGSVERLDTKCITGKLHGEALAIHCSASKHLVDSYRTIYSKIPAYWKVCDRILDAMHRGVKHTFGPISTEKDRVWLPNGLSLHYKGLSRDDEGSWRYVGKRGEKQYIYSGKFTENLDQALSRIVMTDAMLKIGDRHPVCMTVHDEVVTVVKEAEADDALAYMIECMSIAPEWATGLPLASEGSTGRSYGEAK